MKVLVAIDDSPYSLSMIEAVAKRHWPRDTEFKILSVIEPVSYEEFGKGRWADVIEEALKRRTKIVTAMCTEVRNKLLAEIPQANIHFDIRQGSAKEKIIDAAAEWSADKIVVGAHGRGVCPRFILGSVSRSVAAHAPCSVEIIRTDFIKAPTPELVASTSRQS